MNATRFDTRRVARPDVAAVAAHRFAEPWGDEAKRHAMRAAYADWLGRLIDDGRYVGFLAEADGRIVAGAGAVLLDWGPTWVDPNPLKARLANVFTLPEFRRQGLARRVVGETLSALREAGIRSVSLASTDAGRALYASLGFELRPGEFGRLLS